MTELLQTQAVQQVINAINNVAMQVEGLAGVEIDTQLTLLGEGSPFDSFAMLLLLVELEQTLDAQLLAGRSLVEWFSTLDFVGGADINLQQFTELLFNDYLGTSSEV